VSGGRRPHEGEPQTWTGESRPSVRETDSHNDGLVTNPQRREVRGGGGSSYADDYTYWHAYRGRVTGPELVIFFPEKWSGLGAERRGGPKPTSQWDRAVQVVRSSPAPAR